MTGDAWKTRAKANEESYFEKMNEAALKRLRERRVLKSPVSGEEMEQIVVMGVTVDRCPSTGGVWLDGGELEKLMNAVKTSGSQAQGASVGEFFSSLFKKA